MFRLLMFVLVLGIDENVVNVNDDKIIFIMDSEGHKSSPDKVGTAQVQLCEHCHSSM